MPENVVHMLYRLKSGPRRALEKRPLHVRDGPLDVDHFFPEEIPERTAEELSGFFTAAP
jgi:hypothetical protein